MNGNGLDEKQGNLQEQDVNRIRGTNKYEWAPKEANEQDSDSDSDSDRDRDKGKD